MFLIVALLSGIRMNSSVALRSQHCSGTHMLVRTSKTQPCARVLAVELPQCNYIYIYIFGCVVYVMSEDGWDRMRIVAACERVMHVLEARLCTCCCSRVGGSSESASISSFETAVYGGGFDLKSLANSIV